MTEGITPFIVRSGFLVSYKRTLPIVYIWLSSFLIACYLSGVLESALSDPEVYATWILWPAVVALNKKMIGDFQDFFEVFSDEDLKYSKKPFSEKKTASGAKREKILEMFSQDEYKDFIDKARELIFHPKQRLLMVTGFGLGFIVLYLAFTFYWPENLFLYGVLVPEVYMTFRLINLVYAYFLVFPILSMAWVLYSMMIGINRFGKMNLKIAKTISVLRDLETQQTNDLMGFVEFRTRLIPVGQFIYGITLRIAGILVLLVMSDVLRNLMHGYDWGYERFIIGGVLVIGTSTLVYISQLGLHSSICKWKDGFTLALQEIQFKMDFQILREATNPLSEVPSPYYSARVDAANRIDSVLSKIETSSTWAINSSNALKIFSISTVPFLTSTIPLIIERFLF